MSDMLLQLFLSLFEWLMGKKNYEKIIYFFGICVLIIVVPYLCYIGLDALYIYLSIDN